MTTMTDARAEAAKLLPHSMYGDWDTIDRIAAALVAARQSGLQEALASIENEAEKAFGECLAVDVVAADAAGYERGLREQSGILASIANLAHLAWTDPPSIKPVFERIESLARKNSPKEA